MVAPVHGAVTVGLWVLVRFHRTQHHPDLVPGGLRCATQATTTTPRVAVTTQPTVEPATIVAVIGGFAVTMSTVKDQPLARPTRTNGTIITINQQQQQCMAVPRTTMALVDTVTLGCSSDCPLMRLNPRQQQHHRSRRPPWYLRPLIILLVVLRTLAVYGSALKRAQVRRTFMTSTIQHLCIQQCSQLGVVFRSYAEDD